jgi:hypothetical protein
LLGVVVVGVVVVVVDLVVVVVVGVGFDFVPQCCHWRASLFVLLLLLALSLSLSTRSRLLFAIILNCPLVRSYQYQWVRRSRATDVVLDDECSYSVSTSGYVGVLSNSTYTPSEYLLTVRTNSTPAPLYSSRSTSSTGRSSKLVVVRVLVKVL